ncbi:hypothetical protein [Hydrogenothermus marinus]|uniref:Uncharacterized protein n=1 Tax=Hydrogenothermus marinus TaxID=133270 RepID=A0A3M0BRE5_9AQUI|nr:hypothetical protein [Hydrogenothermus marinus]RMA97075.1 hypothetical protein CLV39_0728 [Hydrogenothermus marinus]
MSDLAKNNKTIKVKALKEYLKNYPDKTIAEIYLEVLENFDDDELVPDVILYNLGFSIDFLSEGRNES